MPTMWLRARGPRCGVYGIFRKVSIHRRIVLRENAFLEHDAHGVFGGHDQIEKRFAGARLTERALHDFCCRSPPVIDGDTGFFEERLLQQFENIRLHRAVNDKLAVLFGGFDLFGVLRERRCSGAEGEDKSYKSNRSHSPILS